MTTGSQAHWGSGREWDSMPLPGAWEGGCMNVEIEWGRKAPKACPLGNFHPATPYHQASLA